MLLITSASIRYSDSPHIVYNTTAGMIEHLTLGVISPQLVDGEDNMPTHEITGPLDEKTVLLERVDDNFVTQGLVEDSGEDRLGVLRLH